MDAGLKVRLNPDGGNQLNFREALRLYLAPMEQSEEQAEDEDYDENGDSEPRKNVLDDYDYDDDFIDDGEVFEDEVAATPPNEPQDPDFTTDEQHVGAKVLEKAPLHHGFGNFWVNKGNLPPKRVSAIPQPPSALGNVVLEHVKIPTPSADENANGVTPPNAAQPGKPAQAPMKKGGEASQKPGAPVPTSGPSETSKKANPTNTVSATNTSKPHNPRPSQSKGKMVQQSVIEEIVKLAALCQKEFGDKKPKLNDPRVQEQLDVMFRAAITAGVGKLFSDIAKDRRVVALSDEVWNRLSFLRVKRANLETLGHALIWSAKEKTAKAMVDKSEAELDIFMRERRGQAAGAEGALMPVVFDNEVDTRIYDWYRAKSELQMAKNQLGSRVKSVKKCVGSWVVSLKKTAFQGWSVAEGEIVEAFRRVEDVKNAAEKQRREMERQQRELDRQRRESEKLEKKRKREEQLAAAAAKRAAVEKGATMGSLAGSGTGSGATTGVKATSAACGPGGTASGSAVAAGAVAPGVAVVKPKPKAAKSAGKTGIQGGMAKTTGKGGGLKAVGNREKNGVKVVKGVKKDNKGDSKGNTSKANVGKSSGANAGKPGAAQRKTSTKPAVRRTGVGPTAKNGQAQAKTKEAGKVAAGKNTSAKTTPDKAKGGKITASKITGGKGKTGQGSNGKSGVGRPTVPSQTGKVLQAGANVGASKSWSSKEKARGDGPETEVIELD